jgi:hypothetical protein
MHGRRVSGKAGALTWLVPRLSSPGSGRRNGGGAAGAVCGSSANPCGRAAGDSRCALREGAASGIGAAVPAAAAGMDGLAVMVRPEPAEAGFAPL